MLNSLLIPPKTVWVTTIKHDFHRAQVCRPPSALPRAEMRHMPRTDASLARRCRPGRPLPRLVFSAGLSCEVQNILFHLTTRLA
jgi:hypothetical protein